jgi:hypothetical protein
MFVVATERAISYTLGRLYGPVLTLSYLDVCGTTCDAIMFVVATERAISHSPGRRYGPVLNLSYLDVYETACGTIYDCSGH